MFSMTSMCGYQCNILNNADLIIQFQFKSFLHSLFLFEDEYLHKYFCFKESCFELHSKQVKIEFEMELYLKTEQH